MTHLLSRLFFILFFLLIIPEFFAKNIVRNITNMDGLSNNSVNCFLEDSHNMLWIGTWDGLNSFNGRDFVSYRYTLEDEFSISNNIIRNIIEPDTASIWIATDHGLNRWDRASEKFHRYFVESNSDSHKGNNFLLVSSTSTGTVICYVQSVGFCFFDKAEDKFVKIKGAQKKDITNFIIDAADNIHILYNDGRLYNYELDYERQSFISGKNYLSEKPIKQIFHTGNMLIAEYVDYVKIIDADMDEKHVIPTPPNKKVSQITSFKEQLVIAFIEGNCLYYDLHTGTSRNMEELPEKVSIFTLYTGTQDILWIGTDGKGIIQLYQDYSSFSRVKTDFPVRSFNKDENGEMLIGTKGEGILKLEIGTNKAIEYASTSEGLISNLIYSMAKNKDGDIFVGTEEYGINIIRKDGQVQTLVMPTGSINFRAIYTMFLTENDKVLWLGTAGYGLIRISIKKENGLYVATNVRQYIPDSSDMSITNNIIYSIIRGKSDNELWIGTRRGGIYLFDINKEIFVNLEDINASLVLSNYDVLTLLGNRSGSIWIGTSYGLNHLSMDSIPVLKKYGSPEGLINNTIHGIIEDGKNNIWISTNQGIASIDPTTTTVNNYSIRDGLHNNEFADGAYYYDNGTIFFGGVNGLTYFNPDHIHFRDYKPRISLSKLRIYNDDQKIQDRIKNNTLELSYNEPYVSLTFIAHEFINNKNCEYRYRIHNLHNKDVWIYNGNNPNIIMTKLPSGKYILEVECTNGDRVWNDMSYSLTLSVGYPWWLSIWAFIGYFLLLATITMVTISFIRNRIRLNRQLMIEQIEKEHKQKTHEAKLDFFTNVAHEFFTPLTLIFGPVQHLLDNADLDSYAKHYIYIIKNNAERMQKLISELIEFRKAESGQPKLKPEKVDIHALIEYTTDSFREMAIENKIDLNLNIEVDAPFITDGSALEKVIFNLVSNAFKYTPVGGRINIDAFLENDHRFTLKIRNTGRGLSEKQMNEIFDRYRMFDTPKMRNSVSSGIGLNMTKQLVNLLGGNIFVESVQHEYTQFSIELYAMHTGELGLTGRVSDMEHPINENREIGRKKDISILVVEDEKDIRTLLKDILAPNYNVIEAENGEEALRIIEKNIPDIILTDMLMPLLDGMGFIDKVKSNGLTSHIPIISITARTSIEDNIKALEHGADLYITKPFHPAHIQSAVKNILNRNLQMKRYYSSSQSSITVKGGEFLHKDDEVWLKKIMQFIEKNIEDESLSIDSISDHMGISRTSLYRRLKDIIDKTPSEFIKDIRLEHAALLLKTTKLTVNEIIFKSGFSNNSHFYKEFKKKYNLSPSKIRKDN
ncbi:hybrid sensor histidine kinase/response regulator transcription factor [Proteiniphilum sp. UBA5384]|uniref:hybrid sensor histidine kinase/response regulator transcription factor n=1 Tax=Proteiniphilum sp. UBA5384 TaxID=1947279 RepID=UPI0025DC7C28|nr:response regulator [Proteiniphilum sp. UBA5384]